MMFMTDNIESDLYNLLINFCRESPCSFPSLLQSKHKDINCICNDLFSENVSLDTNLIVINFSDASSMFAQIYSTLMNQLMLINMFVPQETLSLSMQAIATVGKKNC